jgi:hypothetical protein
MFPGNKIPDWFNNRKEVLNSNSCKIDVNEPAHLDDDEEITRVAFSAVIGAKANIPDVQDEGTFEIIFEVINDGVTIYSSMEDIPGRFHSDHVWLHYDVPESSELKGDNLRVTFKLSSTSMFFKSCGFHLVRHRYEEKAVDLMDAIQLSKGHRDDDDDDDYGNLESDWYPQQKRHSSTLGIRNISDAEDMPYCHWENHNYTN